MINKSFVLLSLRMQSTINCIHHHNNVQHKDGASDYVSTVCTIAVQILRLLAACDNACGIVRVTIAGVPLYARFAVV